MTTYTAILDTQVDPDAPITSGLGYQFRDNPIAIAEGASGAPRIAVKPISGSASGTGGISITFTSLVDFSGVELHIFAINNDSVDTGSVTIEFSTDGGSTFSASSSIMSLLASQNGHASGFVDFVGGSSRFAYSVSGNNVGATAFTVAGASSSVNAFRLSFPPDGEISAYGTLNGGSTTV